jgi:hypothetical protein
MDYLERGPINDSNEPCDWMLAPAPRLRGLVPTLTIATVFAIPFSLVAGFVATSRPLDGLYAVPLLLALVAYCLRKNLG